MTGFATYLVPDAIKDAIVDRFDEFTAGASSVALAAVAGYALNRGKNLTFPEVARLATERVNAMIVLQLLQSHLPSLTLAELSPVLNAVGGKYAQMSEANGKRPSIANTDADRALADRLQVLGVVSSLEQRGAELKVNMRRR